MATAKGVEILLEPRTRVPSWVRNQTLNVQISSVRLNSRRVRSLRIRKGETEFFPGGGVLLKMPGSSVFWGAFQPLKVLEIRDLKGNLIKRNYYLCTKCYYLAGKIESSKPSKLSVWGRDTDFECARCGYKWSLEGI